MKTTSIIIGNGTSCLFKENGNIIDSYDKVIRLNNFIINGFEKFVGKKTNIWCHSNNIDIKHRDTSDIDQILIFNKNIPELKNNEIDMSKKCFIDFTCKYSLTKLGLSFNSNFFPSLGIKCLLFYISLIGPITYIGFDCFDTGHYWNSNWSHWEYHNPLYEKIIISTLKEKKLLFTLE